jgi:Zn ribbon nucleic-acid-binding protein
MKRRNPMGTWNGLADCPKCGGKGTMMVHGQTSTLEIDGCWICGYGHEVSDRVASFVPLRHLRVERSRPSATLGGE